MKNVSKMQYFCILLASCVSACTLIAVGKNATNDGVCMIAHTDDAGGGAADLRLVNVPHQFHANGSQRSVYNFNSGYPRLVTLERGEHYRPVGDQNYTKPLGAIPQVTETFAYFDQDYGMMNEVQLSIGESTCASRTVGWSLDKEYGYNMFGIAELSKVALERCATARCAVQTMGDLAVEYGFFSEDSGLPEHPDYMDSAESLAIGDRNGEVWVFHVLTGLNNKSAIWGAQRLEDDQVSVIANSFIIREMDLSNSDRFLASPGIQEIAQSQGWWEPEKGAFDFTASFGYTGEGPLYPLYTGRRVWRVFDLVAPSLKLDSTLGLLAKIPTYPFSVKPDKLVDEVMMMSILKDYYQGTQYDASKGLGAGPFGSPVRYDGPSKNVTGGWERTISMFRTIFSFVLRPDPNGCVLWYGQSAPHGTVYVPFSCRQQQIPDAYLTGTESKFTAKSAWWAFSFVNNWSLLRYNVISKDIIQEQERLQEQAFEHHAAMKIAAQGKNDSESMMFFQVENNRFATGVVNAWWNLAWKLVSKFSDGYIVTGELAQEMKTPGYPAWWLQVTNFSKWPGNAL